MALVDRGILTVVRGVGALARLLPRAGRGWTALLGAAMFIQAGCTIGAAFASAALIGAAPGVVRDGAGGR